MSPTSRKILILAAVVFALAAPALQALLGFGLSASEFAGQGDSTLRAAGYGFSIWSVIYAGFLAYAIYQALSRNDGSPLIAAVALPSVFAIAGCGGWILASAFDARWLSVAIILVSAGAMIAGLAKATRRADPATWGERLCVWWPLGLLAGWLTIAAALNILTVLTAEGLLTDAPKAAAFAGLAAVLIAALVVLRTTHLVAYGLPVAWGLVAVWVAERATKGDVATAALAAAALITAYAAWQLRPARSHSGPGRA